MCKKDNREYLNMLSSVEIYKMVLRGDLTHFPLGFWTRPEAKESAVEVIRYLIEEYLKLTDEQIKTTASNVFFTKYKLRGMLNIVFKWSTYEAINSAYPNIFTPWELKSVPNDYWNTETGKQAVKWLIEDTLKLSPLEPIPKVSWAVFKEHRLTSMLYHIFDGSPQKAIKTTYPEMKRNLHSGKS
jgi:hypothetical protein